MDGNREFLWKLFCLHVAGAPAALVVQHVNAWPDIVDEQLEVFRSKITGFISARDRELLDGAVIAALERRFFNTLRHVQLVAIMVAAGRISLTASADLLNLRRSDEEALPVAVADAIDIAWLINQDRRDGVMEADEDTLLMDALANVAAGFRKQLSLEQRGVE